MRYSFAIALALVTTAPALTQEAKKREIGVTALSLKDTADALKKCLGQKCPRDQDIKATLAHAENQFVDCDYKGSRATLLASLGRNRKHKKGHREAVSNLLRATANIAAQLGEGDSYRLSVLDMRDTLKGAESFAIVGEKWRTRLDRTAGKSDAADELIKRYVARGFGGSRPVLVAANPIKAN